MLTALFFRHGETGLNEDDRFRGMSKIGLNQDGIAQARQMASKYGHSLERIYSSDLPRAAQYAKIISKGRIPVHLLPDLRAKDIGDFEGKPRTAANLAKLHSYSESGSAPPNGENDKAFGNRFRRGIGQITGKKGATVGVVLHGSGIRELGVMLHGDMKSLDVKPGGVVKVENRNGDTKSQILSGASHENVTGLS